MAAHRLRSNLSESSLDRRSPSVQKKIGLLEDVRSFFLPEMPIKLQKGAASLWLVGCFGLLVRALILPWQPQGKITLQGKTTRSPGPLNAQGGNDDFPHLPPFQGFVREFPKRH